MKSQSTKRAYRQAARARSTEQTGRDIVEASVALWREVGPDRITLKDIAERAGVTVQTIIRRFGSKDGLFDACIESDATRIVEQRDAAPVGDVGVALDLLFDHYEQDGDAALRTLAVEESFPAAARIARAGRAVHRAWCERVFAPYLPPKPAGAPTSQDAPEREARIDAFVAATDLYLWKLLRRDLGRSRSEAQRVVRALVEGLTATAGRGSA